LLLYEHDFLHTFYDKIPLGVVRALIHGDNLLFGLILKITFAAAEHNWHPPYLDII
jgi:hypothetical protein